MNEGICINNVPVTWEESRLFDLYRAYLRNMADRNAFVDHNKYDHFEQAKHLYEKIMG